ncbi:MAG TPA: type II toxin-antitoxin system VapB family antitoxin [Beijerinckiaceae bacterium]|jgi:hypothetical protein|nr:type II toxin-antitoxin system VapB family antitoxin [Beijerinckiaceae bacterium]
MPRQLNIRSDEAHRLAHLIADQTGRPVVDVVVEALRDYGSKLPPVDDMTPTQRAGYEALRKLARRAVKYKHPGATSDHSDLYDEHGLPI